MEGLIIGETSKQGYEVLVRYGEWRVAFITYADNFAAKNLTYLERHMKTDEVFVLLKGKATLIIGEGAKEIEMEEGKTYNVACATWHNIFVSEDAKVLICENLDTSRDNSEYMPYSR